jgi:hypothetical protein
LIKEFYAEGIIKATFFCGALNARRAFTVSRMFLLGGRPFLCAKEMGANYCNKFFKLKQNIFRL